MVQPYHENEYGRLYQGDALAVLRALPDQSVNCCVTSPPYWGLRDYGVSSQIGLEPTIEEYIHRLVEVFHEVRRVLYDDGTLWLNMGDSYARAGGEGRGPHPNTCVGSTQHNVQKHCLRPPIGLKDKDLIGMPWRVAFALQVDGWYLRQDIIWAKPNPMPESVRDRCTKAHEYLFLFSKRKRYYYDHVAIMETISESSITRLSQEVENQQGSLRANGGMKENGTMKAVSRRDVFDRDGPVSELVIPGQRYAQHRKRSSGNKARKYGEDRDRPDSHLGASVPWAGTMRNKRDVWTIATNSFEEAHFATFPPALVEPCILAGCPEGGTALDPFMGSGTVGEVCQRLGRRWVGIEINPAYCDMVVRRVNGEMGQIEGQVSFRQLAEE
jgi:DNA modification methylase